MKIVCKCGALIPDSTDGISYKAHVLPDEDWDFAWEKIDDAIEKSGPAPREKEKACMDLRYLDLFKMTLYYCTDCGRIILNNKKNELVFFQPESGEMDPQLFSSVRK